MRGTGTQTKHFMVLVTDLVRKRSRVTATRKSQDRKRVPASATQTEPQYEDTAPANVS